ncbi:MAG: Na+/H+ antiporter NhaC family protein [Agathobacter sp.]
MDEKKTAKNYGAKALLPLLVFLALYVGCGIVFTILGTEEPFWQMPRYVAILIAILVAIVCFEREKSITEKVDIYCENAGKPGVMQLGMMVLMAGGFASVCSEMGAEESLVNLGVSLIPSYFLVPGIFAICAIISTCIGTSMGTLATMIPVTAALTQGAGLNPAMAGAAVITGSYFGDNLSMIAGTTICAVRGVGGDMKEKFKINFSLAFPSAILTMVGYAILSMGSGTTAIETGNYNLLTIIPYISTLVFALMGMDVILVLAIGIALAGVIGIVVGNITFFGWAKAISSGMESMFWLAVFAMMISGLIGLIRYYGGIDWMVNKVTKNITGRKSCEYILCLLSLVLCATIVNNVMTIMILAPIAKEVGERYKINPSKLACLLDIGACVAVMIVPHGTGAMMAQEAVGCTYIEVLKYQFYPLLLMIFSAVSIQFGNIFSKIKKNNKSEGGI